MEETDFEEESAELRAVLQAVTNTNKKIDDEYEEKDKRLSEKKKGPVMAETDQEKVQKLKDKHAEMKSRISMSRRDGKDPFIADLTLRTAPAKIKMAETTLEKRDFDIVEELFSKVEKELAEANSAEEINVKKEIEKKFRETAI